MSTILIVDDDLPISNYLKSELKSEGETLVANNVEDAIDALRNNPISLVLSDYKLGARNGNEIAEYTSKLVPAPPVVLMTGFADKDMAVKALNLGVYSLIEKPFELPNLRDKVRLGLKEYERRLKSAPVAETSNSSDDFRLNPAEAIVEVGGRKIKLTTMEFDILSTFLGQKNHWIKRQYFEEKLWNKQATSRNAFDTHLSNLRKKVPELKGRIRSIRGRGYIFE